MKRSVIITLTALAVAVLGSIPAQGAPTGISGLAASASGTSVTVTGSVAFGGEDRVEVGTDAVNDNLGGAQTAPLGLDIQSMSISQPNPASPVLEFVLDLSAMTADGIPEHVAYNWDVAVNGGAAQGGSNYSIKTWRTQVRSTTNANPYAAIFTCQPQPPPQTGYTCSPSSTVTAVYDGPNSQIRLSVPLAGIDAAPGSTIEGWDRIAGHVYVGGTAGTQTLAGLYDEANHGEYTVPTKDVKVGIAPAGGAISYATPASLSGNSFSGTLSAAGPGSYDVGARACFGANCATATTTVTVG